MAVEFSPSTTRADLHAAAQAKLRALGAAVDQLDGAVARRYGRNRTDIRVLEILDDRGQMSAGELAAATHLTNAALTSVVDRLADHGFVIRRDDSADRRRVLVELTEEAHQLSNATFAGLYQRIDELLARYSDDELAIIVDFLIGARDALLGHVADLRAEEK